MISRALLIAALLGQALAASADHWPGWRGPTMDGHSRERNLPLKWSATENVRWKAPLPGPGMSSPIVWGDRVFLTQSLDRDGHKRAVLCFDRKNGRRLWQRVTDYPEKESTYSGEPHYCSASPITDGERVVAWFGSAGVVCYDFAGRLLWRRDLGKCEQVWGNASSPILYRDLVLLNFGPGERTFLLAMNKKTGKDVWRVDEPGGKYGGDKPEEWLGSWSTPVIVRVGERDELILPWPNALKAFDPLTGRLLWTCKGLGPLIYTSPLATPEVVVVASGFMGPTLAVKPGGSGDVTATRRLWREEKAPQRIGSGVLVGDYAYLLNENGTIQCVEWKTGKTRWMERVAGQTWGSLIHADGRLYVTNQRGETVVLSAKPTLEVLARNPLNERTQSSPAVSKGEIFIRTYEHLWCIGKKE